MLVDGLNRCQVTAEQANHTQRALIQATILLMSVSFAERQGLVPSRLGNFAQALHGQQALTGWQLLQQLMDATRDTVLGRSPGFEQWVNELETAGRGAAQTASELGGDTLLSRPVLAQIVEQVLLIPGSDNLVAGVQVIGEVYESLLGSGLWQLPATALKLKPHGAWVLLQQLLATPPPERGQWLHSQAGIGKGKARQLTPRLARAESETQLENELKSIRDGSASRASKDDWVLQPSGERRRSGSHYTPLSLATVLVEQTLAPLLQEHTDVQTLLELRICDPSMGSGILLCCACDLLAKKLARVTKNGKEHYWRRQVVKACLFGVDSNPTAVAIAQLTLSLLATTANEPAPELGQQLVVGNAVVGNPFSLEPSTKVTPPAATSLTPNLDWSATFPTIAANGGFDVLVGNPPWVSYAGRAAQPITEPLGAYFQEANAAFAGYRTLHGVFTYRSAQLLREGGRLGLVLPTSVADLKGYAATRQAHDSLCEIDTELPDFGDGCFEGVFQPCMALLSTRRRQRQQVSYAEWTLQRSDLSDAGKALLAKLSEGARLPQTLFGERGYQTRNNDLAELKSDGAPPLEPIREGTDITEFCALKPRLWVDPTRLAGRFRPYHEWEQVKLLIRQTARFPIASLGDGLAFRNSILAGFATDELSDYFLLGYLNSQVIRWYHFMRHRDARQGMPQLKIGHLRNLPHPKASAPNWYQDLSQLSEAVSATSGDTKNQREQLEALVAEGLGLTAAERTLVEQWAGRHPLPRSRR